MVVYLGASAPTSYTTSVDANLCRTGYLSERRSVIALGPFNRPIKLATVSHEAEDPHPR